MQLVRGRDRFWTWLNLVGMPSAPKHHAVFAFPTCHLIFRAILWEQKCACYSHLTDMETENLRGKMIQGWTPISLQSHSCSAIPCLTSLHATLFLPFACKSPSFSFRFTSKFLPMRFPWRTTLFMYLAPLHLSDEVTLTKNRSCPLTKTSPNSSIYFLLKQKCVQTLKAGRHLHNHEGPGSFFNMAAVLESKNIALAPAITFDFQSARRRKRK